eukprot:scaffold164548_cov31-Prasinocladus_malaysianus.AAC.1
MDFIRSCGTGLVAVACSILCELTCSSIYLLLFSGKRVACLCHLKISVSVTSSSLPQSKGEGLLYAACLGVMWLAKARGLDVWGTRNHWGGPALIKSDDISATPAGVEPATCGTEGLCLDEEVC